MKCIYKVSIKQVTQVPAETVQANIDARVKKLKSNFWGIMGSAFHVAQSQPIDISVKLMKTILMPRLVSGLHSLTMTDKQMKSLDTEFSEILRNVVGFRRNYVIACVAP